MCLGEPPSPAELSNIDRKHFRSVVVRRDDRLDFLTGHGECPYSVGCAVTMTQKLCAALSEYGSQHPVLEYWKPTAQRAPSNLVA
jgi:hypothetical protein